MLPQYSRLTQEYDLMIFCVKINIKLFYKLVVWFLLVIARQVQSTQSSNFVISLQHFKNEWKDKVGFLHAEKHETILQAEINGAP